MKRLLTTLFLFALVLPVLATDYFVDPAAPPGGDGSAPFPFNTIGAALANAINSGDNVICAEGDYYDNIAMQSGTPGHDCVTVMGAGTGLSFSHGVVSFNGTDSATVMGFTIYNDVTFDADTASVLLDCEVNVSPGISFVNGSTGMASNCYIHQNSTGVTFDSSAATVDGCYILQNGGNGIEHTGSDASESGGCYIYENGADGILAEGSSTPTSSGNQIYENTANGIHVAGSADMTSDGDVCEDNFANGFYMEDSSQATITSLTSESNTLNGLYIEGSAYAGTISNCTIEQNTLNGIWIDSSATASMTINNNSVSQNDQHGIQFGFYSKSRQPITTTTSLSNALPDATNSLANSNYESTALTVDILLSSFSENGLYGMYFNANHTYKVENCTVQNNDLGVVVCSGVNPDLGGGAQSSAGSNDFSDNTTRDFVNNSASNVYAKLCDWTASAEAEMSGEHPDTVDVTLIDDHWEDSSWGYVMWDDFGGGAVEETTWGQIKNQF
jgi:parallel beta-helix repeat protein